MLSRLISNDKDIYKFKWVKNELEITFNYIIDKSGHAKDVEIMNDINQKIKKRIEKLIKDFIIGKPAISGNNYPVEISMRQSLFFKRGYKIK